MGDKVSASFSDILGRVLDALFACLMFLNLVLTVLRSVQLCYE